MRNIFSSILLTVLTALSATAALAQDPRVTGDQDGSSQQVEESDEAYRRRMELEDARRANPTYTDPVDNYQRELEKIDKLPEESRENIRDQLIDIIMENNDWQPGDALEEYPYEPTAAAQADADLMKQEQEAWDEQIEKYHAREAEAFGAYRGPVAGPGNPDGQEGAEGGQQGQEGGEGGGQGQQGGESGEGQEGSNGSAGTYQPQNNTAEDGDSTAGVSESALDFLMGRRAGSAQGQQQGQQQQGQQQQGQQQQDQQQQDQQQQPEAAEDSEQETEPDMRGIIAIEDLDKLEGTRMIPIKPPEEEQDPDDP